MPKQLTAHPKAPPINKWVVDAINFAEMTGADLARELFARKIINTADRSVPSKIAQGKREVEFREALAIADITGYQPPIPVQEIAEVQYTGPVGAGHTIRDISDGSIDPQDKRAILAHVIDLSRTAISDIKGDSLGKMFEGWYVVHTNRGAFHDGLYGKLCVVETQEGDVLLKWAARSKGKGVKLLSGDETTHSEDASIVWAAEVIGLRPQ